MGEGHQLRWGGVAGIAAVLLAVAARLVVGNVPADTATPRAIALFLVENRTQILAAALLGAAAVVCVLWFGAALSTALRRADESSDAPAIVLAGFTLVCALGFLAASAVAAVTYALTEIPYLLVLAPGPYTAIILASAVAGIAVALPMGALAAGILGTHVLPTWLGWFAVLVAVVQVLAAAGAVSGVPVFHPAGPVIGFVPWILTALWVLAASGLLVREHLPSIAARPTPSAPPAVGPA